MNSNTKKTLLLVEDEVLIAMAKQKELERYGYNVLTVNSGEKAVTLFEDNPNIDLILMDIDLGRGIDGTKAAELILKNKNIPIVFLSSHTEPEIVEKTEKITSYGYVVKNSSITVLDASIKMAFKLFQANYLTEKNMQHQQITLNSIGDGVISTDKEGLVVNINPVAQKLTGWTLLEARGLPLNKIFFIINAGTRDIIENPVKEVLKNGLTVGLANHTVLISKNGTEYPIADSAAPIKDSNGTITGVVLVFRDVTEEYKIRERLDFSEEKFRKTFQISPDSININALDGRYIDINDGFTKLTGYTREDVIGVLSSDIKIWAIPEDRDLLIAGLKKEGIIKNLRSSFRCKDGSLKTAVMSAQIIDIKNEPHILSFTRDLTESINSEETLFKLSEAIKQSPESIVVTNLQGNIEYANPKFCELTGYSPEEIKGKNPQVLQSGETPNGIYTELWDTILEGNTWQGNFINKKKNGEIYYERAIIAPIKNDSGRIINFLGIKEDITSINKTEEKIRRKLLDNKFTLKEVHHRIKNNFASIGSILSMQSDSLTNPEAIRALQDAISRVHSMKILYDKLSVSDNFKQTTSRKYLITLIDDIVTLFSQELNISVIKKIDDFTANSKELFPIGLIINELLTNILKYAFVGRTSGLVEITVKENSGRISLTVKDNGIGLPEGFDINAQKGFGIMLINMLSEQLEGVFTIENDNGTKCTLEFKI